MYRNMQPFARSGRIGPHRWFLAWAIGLSVLAGAIGLFRPAEDVVKGLREAALPRRADGDIVVVAMDDKTAHELGSLSFSRKNDARVLDDLFALGARRVFFDRIYADPTDDAGDNAFAAALIRHRGQVFLGEMHDQSARGDESYKPNIRFADAAKTTLLNGLVGPFAIGIAAPYGMMINGRYIPGMSSVLAQKITHRVANFRPNFSILAKSVPTYCFIDILKNKVERRLIFNKDVIIAPTSSSLQDVHYIFTQGYFAGVYSHVIAAQTLKEGSPSDWGWWPGCAVGLVIALAIPFIRHRGMIVGVWLTMAVAFGLVPFMLHPFEINVDIIPGLALSLASALRFHRNRTFIMKQTMHTANVHSGLPNLNALRLGGALRQSALIALKIINHDQISAVFDGKSDARIAREMAKRIATGDHRVEVFHDSDTLLWFCELVAIEEHLAGLHRICAQPMMIGDATIDVQVAFGVDRDANRPVESRLATANLAAGEAARLGQRWQFYRNKDLDDAAIWQLGLMSRLDQAITQRELWVAYQPKLNLETGIVYGAEALVRWAHPDRGELLPGDFVDAAEKHNQIARLTRFVLNDALEVAKAMSADGGSFPVAVNISTQLIDGGLLPMILEALIEHRVSPALLTLEITETRKLERTSQAREVLNAIAGLGVRISIDDYGTGNATLEYLETIPADEIKIDRQFIFGLENDARKQKIVESTIRLAHEMGRAVVAEGVETIEALKLLERLKCNAAQGYLIGKPMVFGDLMRLHRASA